MSLVSPELTFFASSIAFPFLSFAVINRYLSYVVMIVGMLPIMPMFGIVCDAALYDTIPGA